MCAHPHRLEYALGLDLADPGFDHSILSEFRTRVAASGLDQVVLDTLLERLAAEGLDDLFQGVEVWRVVIG